ncbi:MAG: N-acetyl-gamma-glutamyl-phosphate reductase [Ruminococcaceae bacterium]|nr:N-acetyl-gamma-glutamyl-phosphate reductase [Oscillospiraceae bacterium]
MEKKKIFIDGREGTTGLRIFERLAGRDDVEMLVLPEETRKDPAARKAMLHQAYAAFLCLPDDAAKESAALAEGSDVILIDTSTAHRTNPAWAYGFPELSPESEAKIRSSKRIAVPGCHASGFVSLVHPLIRAGVLPADAALSCFSVTGYSGGGKKMIAQYEADERDAELDSPRQYALAQSHKHLPEMQAIPGLSVKPIFCPIVADYYSGMTVTVPVFASQLKAGTTPECLKEIYKSTYTGGLVSYDDSVIASGMAAGNTLSGNDTMKIAVSGNEERILLISHFDNLGKGASGAAVQCLNLVLGQPMSYGLSV